MNIEENKHLWAEFAAADNNTWKAQILQDIKRATVQEKQAVYENNMRWKTYEGVTIEPFYTEADVKNLPAAQIAMPTHGWQNRQYILITDAKEANIKAVDAVSNGATALLLDFSQVRLADLNIAQLLYNLKLSDTPISFWLPHLSIDFLEQLKQLAPYQWKGSLFFDPLSFYTSTKDDKLGNNFEELTQAISLTKDFPNFRALTVSSHHFHEAGASAVQELAFLLNAFVEYAHRLSDKGIAVEDIFSSTEFSLSVSTNYFVEIAKLRALPLLYRQVASAYHIEQPPAFIHAQTARWNKPETDTYSNLIRGTIEAMAAVLGGASAITVFPYTSKANDDSALRLSRNISLILKEESYFDKVLNAAAGAYYIEHLTYTLATEAWNLFQLVESRGGYLQALEEGLISEQIRKVREAKEADYQTGKLILVGANKYAPAGEQVLINKVFNEL